MLAALIHLHVILSNLPVLSSLANGGGSSPNRKIQLAGNALADLITSLFSSEEDSELQTDYWLLVLVSLILLAYIASMSYVIRTLYREYKERLTPFTPETIRALAPNPDRDADGKAMDICSELDDYPPIENKQLANRIRERIMEAASYGPSSPNVLNRLNGHIEYLNAATKRTLTFPGFTTSEKHGCSVTFLLIFAVMLLGARLYERNVPSFLIPFILIFVFAGLYIIALTPEYMREKVNSSRVFRALTMSHEVAQETVTETAKQADRPVIYKVTDSFGRTRFYEAHPDAMGVIGSIAAACFFALLIFMLSVYILLFLTVFFICQNYIFCAANTTDFLPTREGSLFNKRVMLRAFGILLIVCTVIAAILTRFDISGTLGVPFWGVIILFVPDCFFSYYNSLSSVAYTSQGKQREAMLEKIGNDLRKHFMIVMLCTSCALVYILVTDVNSIRITRSNAAIRSERNKENVYSEEEDDDAKQRKLEREQREAQRKQEIEEQREQIRQQREEKAAQDRLEREQKEAQRRQKLEQQKEQSRQKREEQAEQRRRQAQEREQQRAQQRASRNNRQAQQQARPQEQAKEDVQERIPAQEEAMEESPREE